VPPAYSEVIATTLTQENSMKRTIGIVIDLAGLAVLAHQWWRMG
jgi:hypothetical protein